MNKNRYKIILLLFSLFSFQATSRVYLNNEKFFSQASCEPRTFCSILKDYYITEPQLVRQILQPYKRLVKEKEILNNSPDLQVIFNFNSSYVQSQTNTYWNLYDGIAIENEFGTSRFNSIWNLQALWTPINFTNQTDREDVVESRVKNYFYQARLAVFRGLDIFLAFQSDDNIFGVISSSGQLDLYDYVLPMLKEFFKKEMFLYKQKLVSMESVLSVYDFYNNALTSKLTSYSNVHNYEPRYVRLKNMVLNSIDAIMMEFLDYTEEHVNLDDFRVCTKKAYLEESTKRRIYDLKLGFENNMMRYSNNLSGFSLNAGGRINEAMNLNSSIGFGFTYQLLESDFQKLIRWDYIIARKNISDDFTKQVEMEENFLNETFLNTKTFREAYLQSKENREQIYLILKGKVINRLGDKNFKFGFVDITEKVVNLLRVLSAEISFKDNVIRFANGLFVGLSQCALSEEIVEGIENL